MNIFFLIILLWLTFQPGRALAKFRQSEQRKETQSRAQGARGCPLPLGDIVLKTSEKDKLVVDSLTPVLQMEVTSPADRQEQEVKVSLVEAASKRQVFAQTYRVAGETQLEVSPQLESGRQYILTASLLCNRERPSTHKSLRVLVVPEVNLEEALNLTP